MGSTPIDSRQTPVGTVSGGSWRAKGPCPRGQDGRRRHCLHHWRPKEEWVCCLCPHTRTDEQATDPNWREDDAV